MIKLSDIMGLNAREKYIKRYNNAQAFRLANDKIYAREILEQFDIEVPKLLFILEHNEDIEKFNWTKLPKEFVIKPAMGSQGKGILVLKHYKDDVYQKVDRSFIKKEDIKRHLYHILDGHYSLDASYDTVVIEQRIKPHPCFKVLDNVGLPDIRVIVVNMVPLMMMLRIPTTESKGKANIHQGGMALGIDMKTGKITHGIIGNKTVTLTTKMRDFTLPYLDEILDYSVRSQEASGIGYLGVDVTIDQDRGPMVLELNAQPGLEIQNANLAPLRQRVEKIQKLKVKNSLEGIKIAKELFSSDSINYRYIPDDSVIGIYEKVQLISKIGTLKDINGFVDITASKSRLENELAKRLGFKTLRKEAEAEFFIKGQKKKGVFELFEKKDENEPSLVLGKDDVKGFYIDVEKKVEKNNIEHKSKTKSLYSFKEIDEIIVSLDKEIKLLSHLNPINVDEEKNKFFESGCEYNPQFEYKQLSFLPEVLETRLENISFDNTAKGILYAKKRTEIEKKIALLKNRINSEEFTKISISLYGEPTDELTRFAKKNIKKYKPDGIENFEIDMEQAEEMIYEHLKKYKLDWDVVIKDDMVARISAGKSGKIFLKKGAKFGKDKLLSTLVHEIDTHVVTAINGLKQDLKLMGQGMGNYLQTQEGLAIYNQCNFVDDHDPEELFFSSVNYLAVEFALKNNFKDLFTFLKKYGYDDDRAWRTSVHIKRGLKDTSEKGCFTKSILYLAGYKDIDNYVKSGGDLKRLYIGKITLEDIKLLDKIPGLKSPALLPNFLK